MVTCEVVRDWLLAYLNGAITQSALIEWARKAKLSAELLAADAEWVGPVLARIGVTGKGSYTLTWEDCFDLLEDLGFAARVIAEPIECEADSADAPFGLDACG